jgi:hypothetical protein
MTGVHPAAARARRHRRLALGFFIVYAIAVTYPGVLPFNRARPFVLGLPFSMVWVTLWIVLGGVVFWLLERATPRDGT